MQDGTGFGHPTQHDHAGHETDAESKGKANQADHRGDLGRGQTGRAVQPVAHGTAGQQRHAQIVTHRGRDK